MTLYKNIFAKSWGITRKHPVLWLLGAFVLFWGGKGIELEQFFTNADLLRSPLSPFRPTFWEGNQLLVLVDTFASNWWLISAFAAVVIVCALLAFALIMAAHIGLIDAYGQFDHSKEERYAMHHAYIALRRYFWSVSTVQLLTKGISYALLAVAAVPLYFDSLGNMQFVYSLALFLVVTPISVLLSVVSKFASASIILDGMAWGKALRNGSAMLWKNTGVVLETMVFVYVIYVLVTTLAIVAVLIVSMPLLYVGFAQWAAQDTFMGLSLYEWASSGIGAVVVFTVASVFSGWHMGTWTLLYQEIAKNPGHTAAMGRMWRKEK